MEAAESLQIDPTFTGSVYVQQSAADLNSKMQFQAT